MKIETKYDIGETVYPIRLRGDSQFINCKLCEGYGKVEIKNSDKKARCPDCYGRCGKATWKKDKCFLEAGYASRIGKIQTETFSKRIKGLGKIRYMIEGEIGIAWEETDLFPTKESARAECDKRNELLN